MRVENNRVVLISDLTMHEMEILPKDLQLCTDMASGVDSLGKFEWGDLVNLDSETVGVIVRLERENFHVLNMHGMFFRLHLTSIFTIFVLLQERLLNVVPVPYRSVG